MEQNVQKPLIYPISFQDFIRYNNQQAKKIKESYDLGELRKIQKLRKILQGTQSQINNRIRLFKKVSTQIQKKKQKQNFMIQKSQDFRLMKQNKQQFFSNRIRTGLSRKNQGNNSGKILSRGIARQNYIKTTKQSHNNFFLTTTCLSKKEQKQRSQPIIHKMSNNLIQQKLANARDVKLEKERNKILIEQMRNQQMRKKMQSADTIRKNRCRIKQIKQLFENERMEEARNIKQEKFRTQIQQYDELQSNLTKLKLQEKQALIMWKKAIQQ